VTKLTLSSPIADLTSQISEFLLTFDILIWPEHDFSFRHYVIKLIFVAIYPVRYWVYLGSTQHSALII